MNELVFGSWNRISFIVSFGVTLMAACMGNYEHMEMISGSVYNHLLIIFCVCFSAFGLVELGMGVIGSVLNVLGCNRY